MIFKYKNNDLMYAIGGDSAGFPVFINYGLIGDVKISDDMDALAKKQKIKLIILERPGYGDSDFIFMDSYCDWADIVGEFLEYLNVVNFAVIGISAGAPFTYAVAEKFADRTTGGIYILSGVPDILDDTVFEKYTKKDKAFYTKIWNMSQTELEKEMQSTFKKYNNFLYRLILPKEIKDGITIALSQNCSGVAQTIRLQLKNWGVDIYNIKQEIHYWHSPKDDEISLAAVQVMVNNMSNAHLTIKGKGHTPDTETITDVLSKIADRI